MKKLLVVLLVVSAIGATSCKKDAETAPAKSLKVEGNRGSNIEQTVVNSWD